MEEYKKNYKSGEFKRPSASVVREYLKKYKLSRGEFGDIVGVSNSTVSRYTADPETSSFLPIPYAVFRLFLIWAGEVDPPCRGVIDDDYFSLLHFKLEDMGISISDLCSDKYLGIAESYYYHLKKKDPELLMDKIDNVIEF